MTNRYIFCHQTLHHHDIPSYYQAEFHWFTDTCYEVLSSRADKEIEDIIIAIDRHILDKSHWFDSALNMDEPLESGLELGLYPSRFHAIILQKLSLEHDAPACAFQNLSKIKNLTWQECYAASLLANCLFAVTQEQLYDNSDFQSSELGEFFGSIETVMGQHAINGMELLTLTRSFSGFDSFPKPTEVFKKELARNAANARWEPSREIKNRYFTWYKQSSTQKPRLFNGYTEAAELFYQSLSDKEREILGEPEVLVKALRKHFRKPKKPN
jgi:hypothetical protein